MTSLNRTKIVATIGPRTNNPEALRALHAAGMDLVRLNGAHGDQQWHAQTIELIRKTLPQVPILLDIPGRKIRLGRLAAPQQVVVGERVTFVHEQHGRLAGRVPDTCSDFHLDVAVGPRVLIDDTTVHLVVRAVAGPDVICEVVVAGMLLGSKGVHFPGVTMRADLLRPRDKELLAFAARQGVDFVGISFVATGKDVETVRKLIGDKSPRVRMNILRGVQGAEAGEEAFDGVLKYVKERNFAAFEALSARRDVILAFHRLNVPATLNVTFLSTNHIENVMGNARGTIGRVCRWHDDTNQVARWMAVALLRAQSGFRRVRGHEQLAELAAALGRP